MCHHLCCWGIHCVLKYVFDQDPFESLVTTPVPPFHSPLWNSHRSTLVPGETRWITKFGAWSKNKSESSTPNLATWLQHLLQIETKTLTFGPCTPFMTRQPVDPCLMCLISCSSRTEQNMKYLYETVNSKKKCYLPQQNHCCTGTQHTCTNPMVAKFHKLHKNGESLQNIFLKISSLEGYNWQSLRHESEDKFYTSYLGTATFKV